MGLFGKKKKEVPELPPLPKAKFDFKLYSRNNELKNLPSLPSFPSTSTAENISKEVVESAVSNIDMPDMSTDIMPELRRIEVPEIRQREIPQMKEKEPIFVRIDKFEAALKNLEEIKKQIAKIEQDLRDLRDIKSKEEQELQQWEHEISEAKLKLNKIDKALFEKI